MKTSISPIDYGEESSRILKNFLYWEGETPIRRLKVLEKTTGSYPTEFATLATVELGTAKNSQARWMRNWIKYSFGDICINDLKSRVK